MIKAVNISKTYYQGRTRIEAVKNVTLTVPKGESVVITGPSGAGKSTLLHLLGGLDKPTGGVLVFDGLDFYKLSDRSRSEIRNEKIGFVFQFYHLLPEFTVLENVMLPALMSRKSVFKARSSIRKRAEYLLEMVGLGKRLSHRPSELSGGESQRAAIARSLVNFPEVLLCDEPTGNLDSEIGTEIIGYLQMFKNKENMALLIVTHDEHIKGKFGKRYRMVDGVVEEVVDDKDRGPDKIRNSRSETEASGVR